MRNVDMTFQTTQWHSVKAPSRWWPNTTEENLTETAPSISETATFTPAHAKIS